MRKLNSAHHVKWDHDGYPHGPRAQLIAGLSETILASEAFVLSNPGFQKQNGQKCDASIV